jgi:hypothetical protein
MKITITPATLHISVPAEQKAQAHLLLQEVWRDEFAKKPHIIMELTPAAKSFVERAKLHPAILVYR